MHLLEAIQKRHSVRQYTDEPIAQADRAALAQFVDACNRESGLQIRLCFDEPGAFSSAMARYGRFDNVKNYIALVGKKAEDIDERAGYYGEKVVLYAQTLGLNTCWVALTFNKTKSKDAIALKNGEKLLMVIALGHGKTQGAPRKSKPPEALCRTQGDMPEWFKNGVQAAMLAPTAVNQQKFLFELDGDRVKARVAGLGVHTRVDLGIAKYHFEIGAGENGWRWAE